MSETRKSMLDKYFTGEQRKLLGIMQKEQRVPLIGFVNDSPSGVEFVEYFEFSKSKIFHFLIYVRESELERVYEKREVNVEEVIERVSLKRLPSGLWSNKEGIYELEKLIQAHMEKVRTDYVLEIIKSIVSCDDFLVLKEIKSILK